MVKKLEIYKCPICGNVVTVMHASGGTLSCCGKSMILQEVGVTDGALEKHVPVVEKQGNGYLVKVGSEPHPMIDVHYIEWIDLITENRIYTKFLKPGEKAEALFLDIEDKTFIVREYCNLHGLWQTEQK